MATRMREDERRRALLSMGQKVFAEHAVDGLTMAGLAREADCSKSLLYHYFGDRRGYYLAVLEDIAGELVAAIRPEETLPFEAALEDALTRFLSLAKRAPSAFALFSRAGVGVDADADKIVARVRATAAGFLRARLGAENAPRFELAAAGWVQGAETIALEWVRGGAQLPLEEIVVLLVAGLDGVRAALRFDRAKAVS